jgi:hypothetical protein
MKEPYLTHRIVEAMRMSGVKTILYASGSGLYGDLGEVEASERHAVGGPISTYGASKLRREALISTILLCLAYEVAPTPSGHIKRMVSASISRDGCLKIRRSSAL